MDQCEGVAESRTRLNEDFRHPPPRQAEEKLEQRIQRRMDVLGRALANKEFTKEWYDYEAKKIRNEEYGIREIPAQYVFKCEKHDKRPKVQTKIRERHSFESDCFNLGMPAKCDVLPNGDLIIGTSLHTTYRIKFRDRLK